MLVFSEKQEPAGAEPPRFGVGFGVAGLAAVQRQQDALQFWGEAQEMTLRLDNLQDQVTGQGDRIARLAERITPLITPPGSEAMRGPYGWQRIQIGLQRSGFGPGPIDGRPGQRTRDAIRGFQQSEADRARTDGILTRSEIGRLW